MIVLDTNVIAELMRGPQVHAQVLRWVRSLPQQPITTVVNRAEILSGLALLPAGARRDRLRSAAETAFEGLGVCLPLMPEAASHYADIVADRRAVGRPIGSMDALIAAICRESGAQLATRDIADFEDLGLPLLDPWL